MKRTLLAAGVVGALWSSSSSALAAGCNCFAVQNMVTTAHTATRQNVNLHTTQVGNYIADTIREVGAQLSAYQKRSDEVVKRVEEAGQTNDTIRERQIARSRAEGGRYDPATSACIDMSGIMNMGGGAVAQGPGGNDVVNASRNRSRGNGDEGQAVRAGGLALAQEIANARDAYVGVGGVLDPTADVRLLTENITLDTTDGDIASAFARLVNNIVDPLPARPLTETELATPAGRAQLAARQIDDARRSPAAATFAFYGDLATPIGGEELSQWAKSAVTDAYPNVVGDQVSTLQALDIFVHSRFANPEWHQRLAKMSPEAVMRETALTNSLNLHVNWLRFQLELRDAAVNASSLAAQLDDRDARSTGGATGASSNIDISPHPGVMNISSGI